ncbi:MAG: hypothetical protein MPI47_09525, partial [Cuniculiplasma sp.]|nr:hypothetical protein [Cuniculiplasma sp.]
NEDWAEWEKKHPYLGFQTWIWDWVCLKKWVEENLPDLYVVLERVAHVNREKDVGVIDRILILNGKREVDKRCPYVHVETRNGKEFTVANCDVSNVKLEEKLNIYNPETEEIERIEWKEVKPKEEKPSIMKPP